MYVVNKEKGMKIIMKEKIIGLIPARMESSRFPGKPICQIKNKPMIYWVYEQALKNKSIDCIYVVTPNLEIKNVCDKYQIPCLYNSKQASTAAEKLSYAIKDLDGDIYLNIQGDEPLLNPLALQQIIDEMLNNEQSYYVGLISKIKTKEEHENRNIVKAVVDHQFNALYFSRMPIPSKFEYGNAYRVLGLYGYRKWFLEQYSNVSKSNLEKLESGIEMLRMLQSGYKIKMLETEYETIGVDLPEHIAMVEQELEKVMVKKYERY